MIPFNPMSPTTLWWMAYRQHIRDAWRYPERAPGYRKAAQVAYVQFLCCEALEQVEWNRKEIQ